MSATPDLVDQLYLAFGPCCAGCDNWQHNPKYTRPLGYCLKRPVGEVVGFDMSAPGSIDRYTDYQRTDAKFVCNQFNDTYDWSQLGVPMPSWRTSADRIKVEL